jgi:hypothetical protein
MNGAQSTPATTLSDGEQVQHEFGCGYQLCFQLCGVLHSPALFADGAGGGGGAGGIAYDAVAVHELAFAAEQLQRGAHNGSAWNYLRGLLTLPGGGDARLHDQRLPQLCCQVGTSAVLYMQLPE